MKDNDYEIIRITEEQLDQISGGVNPSYSKEMCSNCRKHYATKGGFIVRDDTSGLIHQVNFKGNMCDSCAEKKLQVFLNQGNTFVRWLDLR